VGVQTPPLPWGWDVFGILGAGFPFYPLSAAVSIPRKQSEDSSNEDGEASDGSSSSDSSCVSDSDNTE